MPNMSKYFPFLRLGGNEVLRNLQDWILWEKDRSQSLRSKSMWYLLLALRILQKMLHLENDASK